MSYKPTPTLNLGTAIFSSSISTTPPSVASSINNYSQLLIQNFNSGGSNLLTTASLGGFPSY